MAGRTVTEMKMKAVQLKDGKVELNEVDIPVISENEVLIKVEAAGVNPFDWKVREGYYQVPPPGILGTDVSGFVEEAGDEVDEFIPGDEVYGMIQRMGRGSFAGFTAADEGMIAIMPKSATFQEAAAMPLAALSAWQTLVDQGEIRTDQKVLIHGGAGGIGTFAIQIAKYLGAEVITTASPKKMDYVRNLGADKVIDYTSERFEDVLRGWDLDVVLDTVGGETYRRSFDVLKTGGIIVSMLEEPDQELMKRHSVTAKGQFTRPDTRELARLARLFDEGKLKVHIDRTFALEEAGGAMDYIKNVHPRGKVVLEIG